MIVATFEGRTPDGVVSDALIDFHRTMAAGGVGLTTVAYCAVAPEGRTDRHQIYLREGALPGLRRLADAVHEAGFRLAVIEDTPWGIEALRDGKVQIVGSVYDLDSGLVNMIDPQA